jgi:hypothetical protein
VQLIKDWFAMLGNWRAAITDLAEDLSEAAGNTSPSIAWPPPIPGAAIRYVGRELLEWHKALEESEREAEQRRLAQASRVFIWQEYREGNPELYATRPTI